MPGLAYLAAAAAITVAPLPPVETPTPVQYNECWQEVGPFATQDRAWAMWRQARGQGYSVSNGVVPCWSGGSRGYCFRVFYAC
ncbi:MAG: hypothetical protein AAGC86_02890 [Pseudomonadota bacterium]